MNKASAVMLVSTGIVDRPLGRKISLAVTQVIAHGDQPGAARPADYLQIEPLLIKAGGPDVTRLHSGRSRKDMLSTSQRLALRDQFLDNFDSLNAYRAALLRLARSAPDAIVPAYTMDQQAQPISFGHFISGFLGAFERQALTPENMVRSSRGLGGPQPSEVARILAAQAARLTADQTWVSGRREALATASRGLDKSFAALATSETSVGDR